MARSGRATSGLRAAPGLTLSIDTNREYLRTCCGNFLPQVNGDESEAALGRIGVEENIACVLLGGLDELLQTFQVDDELDGGSLG